MASNKLPLLLGATVVVLGLGFWLNQSRAPVQTASSSGPLVPGLAEGLNSITGVKVTGPENKVLADLNRGLNGWVMSNRADYPADVGKVRDLLIKLSESRLRESKTSNPDLYTKLGLEDLALKDAKGVQVELNGLKQPSKLLIGSFSSAGGQGYFVRRDGEKQTYLASGSIRPETTESAWIMAEIVNIGSPRIRRVDVTPPKGSPISIEKTDPQASDYNVLNVPKGRTLSSPSVGNAISTTLDALRLDDVMKADAIKPDETSLYKVRHLTHEGVVVTLEGWEQESKSYARFRAELDPAQSEAWLADEALKAQAEAAVKTDAPAADTTKQESAATAAATEVSGSDAKADSKPGEQPAAPAFDAAKFRADKLAELNKEVETINKRVDGWVYQIPSWKFANFKKTMDELLAAK